MSEIIDILQPNLDNAYAFVPNNLVPYVAMLPAQGGDLTLRDGSARAKFQKGDNFSILSAGIVLPEAFTYYRPFNIQFYGSPQIKLALKGDSSGLGYTLDVLGTGRALNVPMENYEFALDIFINTKNQKTLLPPTIYLNEDFSITYTITNGYVSMAGLPAALNGVSFAIIPFVKILHNKPLL